MALPNGGGGYQVGDGNLSEIVMGYAAAPQTATVTANLTVAQITGGMLVVNPGGATAIYTLPTAADIDATVTSAKVGSTFQLSVINTDISAGTVTFAPDTGITDGGNAFVAMTPISSGIFTFRKTGDAAWSVYKSA